MRKNIYLVIFLFTFYRLQAQESFHEPHRIVQNTSTGFSGTGANIDIKYHKLNWRINPDSSVKYIKGYVQTNFVTTQNNVSSISFDLNAVLTIDSVIYHGIRLNSANITRTANIFSIALGNTLAIGMFDSVTVYYQGTPPSPSGSATGFVKTSSATAGNYITTLSESYEDRDWWPCKADMQDKIDSVDIIVNVPWAIPTAADTFWVASNGILKDSSINGTSRTFVYQTRYPMASYLVFVSVAKFNRYYSGTTNIGGTDVPSVYYLLAGKTDATYTNILTAMDKMKLVLQLYSNKFSDYPFKEEKHGYYDGLYGAGGMEHQTFSGINSGQLQTVRTLSHELMHQWFGDNVTFSTWNDLWLAEGFARYSECYVAEMVPVLGLNQFTIRNSFKNSALALNNVSLWIPDANIVNSNTIWSSSYGSAVYERGAMVVSMLRAMCGDTKYFQAVSNYQTGMSGRTANADSLKNYFNAVLGMDISDYFDDYVGGSGNGTTPVGGIGNPVYTINWKNPTSNRLLVSVGTQTQTSGSNVTYFRGPVVIRVKGSVASQDTTITFFDWGSGNLSYAGNGISAPIPGNELSYDLSFTPVTVLYDDSSRTLSTGTTVKLNTVAIESISFNAAKQNSGNKISLNAVADNIARVELLRSANGIDFNYAGDMNLVATTQNNFTFVYNDLNPFYPVTYYKARIHNSGRETFSEVASVSSAMFNGLVIAPNPAHENLSIRFDNPSAIKTTIQIIDAGGKMIKSFTTTGHDWNINVHAFAKGMYVVQQVVNGKVVKMEKMVVE